MNKLNNRARRTCSRPDGNGDATTASPVDGPAHDHDFVEHAVTVDDQGVRRATHDLNIGLVDDAEEHIRATIPDAFSIHDESSASWLVRKVVELRHYAHRVREWADRELRNASRDEEWLLRRFGPELEAWLRAELDRRGGRRRSVALAAGTVGLRLQPPRVNVVDETLVGTWCLRNLPEAIRVTVDAEGKAGLQLAQWSAEHEESTRVTRKLMREPIARHVAESGELPEGVELLDAVDRLYVK